MSYFNVAKGIRCILIGLILFSINIVTHPSLALGASASISVSLEGGGVRATVNGSFSSCNGDSGHGAVYAYLNNTAYPLCSTSGDGSASCSSNLIDRALLNGTNIFYAYASDCKGTSDTDIYKLTLDNTPEIKISSPTGTVLAPFNITGTAVFTPPL